MATVTRTVSTNPRILMETNLGAVSPQPNDIPINFYAAGNERGRFRLTPDERRKLWAAPAHAGWGEWAAFGALLLLGGLTLYLRRRFKVKGPRSLPSVSPPPVTPVVTQPPTPRPITPAPIASTPTELVALEELRPPQPMTILKEGYKGRVSERVYEIGNEGQLDATPPWEAKYAVVIVGGQPRLRITHKSNPHIELMNREERPQIVGAGYLFHPMGKTRIVVDGKSTSFRTGDHNIVVEDPHNLAFTGATRADPCGLTSVREILRSLLPGWKIF